MRYEQASPAVIDGVSGRLSEEVASCDSLEESARRLVDLLGGTFGESAVLTRTFMTISYGRLPAFERAFVDRLTAGATVWVSDRMPVLTLLATRGVEEAWNDRRRSKGHVAIPLASPDYVDAIPMVSSLMKSLGLAIRAVGKADTSVVAQAVGSSAGLFHVDDARTARDSQGRLVISAQDFVERYAVRSVFGFGGAYAVGGAFTATIAFTTESIPRETAERFMDLASVFKAATVRFVSRERFFQASPPPPA